MQRPTRTFVNRDGVQAIDRLVDSKVNGRVHKRRGSTLEDGLEATPRQLIWLELAARFKFLTYNEAAAWVDTHYRSAAKTISRGINKGVFDAWRVGVHPQVITPTKRAANHYGLGWLLPESQEPRPLTMRHTSAVTRLGLFFTQNSMYPLTEREVRAALRNPDDVHLVARDTAEWGTTPSLDPERWIIPTANLHTTARADGSEVITSGYRLPDLVLLRDGSKPVAIEAELTPKSADAYEALFADYLSKEGTDRFAGVQYFCYSRALMADVNRVLKKHPSAAKFIKVSEFPTMPLPIERTERVSGRRA